MPRLPMTPIHLKPQTDLAERVLLPGDPHRALAVAQALMEQPAMFNHHRGLWGYSGAARDGEPLSIQSTGMGGPSAAIVVEELIEIGAKTLIRIGTCGALTDDLDLGELVWVEAALSADGASRALGAEGFVEAGIVPEGKRVRAVSTDLFYDAREETWAERGISVVEMEAATVLHLAALRGVQAGCVLAVSDLISGERVRADADRVAEMGLALGEAAWSALV